MYIRPNTFFSNLSPDGPQNYADLEILAHMYFRMKDVTDAGGLYSL